MPGFGYRLSGQKDDTVVFDGGVVHTEGIASSGLPLSQVSQTAGVELPLKRCRPSRRFRFFFANIAMAVVPFRLLVAVRFGILGNMIIAYHNQEKSRVNVRFWEIDAGAA